MGAPEGLAVPAYYCHRRASLVTKPVISHEREYDRIVRVRVIVFNVTFNNILVLSCGQFYW